MSLRRKIHLRLCAGAVLLSLPVAATSSNAVTGVQASASTSPQTGSAPVAAQPFGATVVTNAIAPLTATDAAQAARRVQSTVDRDLGAASPTRADGLKGVDPSETDIPRTALVAYQVAASTMRQADPDCGIDWSLLAAIGRVETDHGRHAGSRLGTDGTSTPLIRGVALDGKGPVARIRDTDGGRLDGDKKWDRAVGPMQFLPSTWGHAGVDADGDGVRSPDNINDAALGAAVYLCAAPGRLDRPGGVRTAVLRYNPSTAYVDLVVRLATAYQEGHAAEIPTGGTTLALGAIQTAPADGATSPTSPGTGQDQPGGKTTGAGPGEKGSGKDGSGKDDAGKDDAGKDDSGNGDGDKDDPGKDGSGRNNGSDGTTGAHVEQPGQTKGGKGGKGPVSDFDPAPVEEPVLVELSGTLTLLEDQPDEDGTLVDQWLLTGVYVDDEITDVLLDVGDVDWLGSTALADLDGDDELELNLDELVGLAERAQAEAVPVVVTVEEGTEPAVVHTVNGLSYRPAE